MQDGEGGNRACFKITHLKRLFALYSYRSFSESTSGHCNESYIRNPHSAGMFGYATQLPERSGTDILTGTSPKHSLLRSKNRVVNHQAQRTSIVIRINEEGISSNNSSDSGSSSSVDSSHKLLKEKRPTYHNIINTLPSPISNISSSLPKDPMTLPHPTPLVAHSLLSLTESRKSIWPPPRKNKGSDSNQIDVIETNSTSEQAKAGVWHTPTLHQTPLTISSPQNHIYPPPKNNDDSARRSNPSNINNSPPTRKPNPPPRIRNTPTKDQNGVKNLISTFEFAHNN